ncbi:MAG TPA: hypothetical protein VIJ14_09950 [Rhabdochlamydiaceae bacterium]
MRNQDWKLKYNDLKLKFHDAVDVAFRLGYEQGAQGAQLQQAQQDQAAAAAQPGMPGEEQPGQDMNSPGSPDGSQLDQHIGTLEGMLSQSKPGSVEQAGLQKSITGLKSVRSDLNKVYEMKKSEKAIDAIAKALKPKFELGKTANKNLSEHGKRALNDQEKIVQDLMKSFEEEEKKAAESINKTLNLEQILKG